MIFQIRISSSIYQSCRIFYIRLHGVSAISFYVGISELFEIRVNYVKYSI